MNRLDLCISRDDYSVQYGCSAQATQTTGGFNRYYKKTNTKHHVVSCRLLLDEADFKYFHAFYLDWQDNPQEFICKLILEGYDFYGELLQDYLCSFVKDSVSFELEAMHFRVYFQLDVFINPISILTSKPYPVYSVESVASSSLIDSAVWIVPNVGYDFESTSSSASINQAMIRDILNVGYSSIENVSSSALISRATIRAILNEGYVSESTSSTASIGLASIRKALIEQTADLERVASTSNIISAKFTNYEINPRPRNIVYTIDGSQIDYTFDSDGYGFTYNYYASSTPMNISSMPAPKATGITAKSYSDLTPLVGDFYVRFSATDGVNEYISDEFFVDQSGDSWLINYQVQGGAWINTGAISLTETWIGTPTFEADAMVLNGTQWLNIANNQAFNFGSSNFEVTAEVMQTNSSSYKALMSAIYYSGTQYAQFIFDSGRPLLGDNFGGFGSNLRATAAMTANVYHTVTVRRASPTLVELLVDNVVVASRTIAASVTFNFNQNSQGTRLFNITWSNENSPFIGKIKSFKLKKG